MIRRILGVCAVIGIALAGLGLGKAPEDEVKLYPGFVTQVRCEGRLILSAVGNDALVRLQAIPKDLGCGVLIQPLAGSGRSNLILETSTGSIRRVLEISHGFPRASNLMYFLKGDPR